MTSPSINENKQLITEYLTALSGKAKPQQLIAHYVSDRALLEHIREAEEAFPEYELIPEEIVAERDLVVVRGLFRGVHRGAFYGIRPTGKTVSTGLIIIYRIDNGLIVQHWMQMDGSGLMEQLTQAAARVGA